VTVAAGCPPSAIGVDFDKNALQGNVHVLRVPRLDFPPSHLWYQLMSLNGLRKLVSESDIVHGQDSSSFPLIYLCKKVNPDLPWVVTVHDGPVAELRYVLSSIGRGGTLRDFLRYGVGFPGWDATLRGDAKYADALVPVSDSLAAEIRSHYRIEPGKLQTIHTGVDIEHLENIARNSSTSFTSDKVRLFWAGRLSWRKGIIHLLNSLSYLVHEIRFRGFELQIFGRGPLEGKVKELVSALNLNDNVRLRGFVKYEELIASMATSDVVCFPSLYEACPVGLIEAMALEKPVVAFDRPFSRELIGDNLPLAKGITDYAENLRNLCTSAELREKLGKRVKAQALEKFEIRQIAKSYLELYRNILACSEVDR